MKYYEYTASYKRPHSLTEHVQPLITAKKAKVRYSSRGQMEAKEETGKKKAKESVSLVQSNTPRVNLERRKSPLASSRKPTLGASIDVSILYKQQNTFRTSRRQANAEGDWRRVPIEFMEEAEDSAFGGLRGRVIYKGYEPKNSWFYLRAVIGDEQPLQGKNRNDLRFNSKFESGNLQGVVRIDRKNYYLLMREDTNTRGLRQWFYFKVTSTKCQHITFRIYKFKKKYSLYRFGMKPYISREDGAWQQSNTTPTYAYDNERRCYYLEFQFQFGKESIQFATLPPYTYTRLLNHLSSLQAHACVKVTSIGNSLAGLVIPMITLSVAKKTDFTRKAVVVLCRTHPGETCSNFALESFIQRVIGSTYLLSLFDIFIIPMVNPDGVVFGNHRTGLSGSDLNRRFRKSDPELFPEVEAVKAFISKLTATRPLQLLFDLHAHSARRNIFAYADDHHPSTDQFKKIRALTKILASKCTSFHLDYCVYRRDPEKKQTARVYFTNITNAITFQLSYGLVQDTPISIAHWSAFGSALADSLIQYHRLIAQRSFVHFLQHQIQQEIILIQQKKQSQKIALLKSMEDKKTNLVQRKIVNNKIQQTKQYIIKDTALIREKQFEKVELNKSFQEQHKRKQTINNTMNEQQKERQNKCAVNEKQDIFAVSDQQCEQQNKERQEINSSQGSSGDESCQIGEDELEELRKNLRIGCMREGVKREQLNIPDKRIQLKNSQYDEQPVLHEHKKSIASRLLRLQMEKREARRVSFPVICLPIIKHNNV